MPFYNTKKANDSKSMFELTLTLISTIYQEFNSRNIPVIIAGDFNADFERKNKFDLILKNYIIDHEFFILDNLNSENSFTFKSSLINNNYYTSNIDHFIFCGPSIPNFLRNKIF
jgi:hypothetical protein